MPKKWEVTVKGHVGGVKGKVQATFLLIGNKYADDAVSRSEIAACMNCLGFDGRKGFVILMNPKLPKNGG